VHRQVATAAAAAEVRSALQVNVSANVFVKYQLTEVMLLFEPTPGWLVRQIETVPKRCGNDTSAPAVTVTVLLMLIKMYM
jgi:hypothetical protein